MDSKWKSTLDNTKVPDQGSNLTKLMKVPTLDIVPELVQQATKLLKGKLIIIEGGIAVGKSTVCETFEKYHCKQWGFRACSACVDVCEWTHEQDDIDDRMGADRDDLLCST